MFLCNDTIKFEKTRLMCINLSDPIPTDVLGSDLTPRHRIKEILRTTLSYTLFPL